MSAAGRSAFTTTMWVVDRVHCYTPNCWADPAPTLRAGLSKLPKGILRIPHFTHSGATLRKYAPCLTGP